MYKTRSPLKISQEEDFGRGAVLIPSMANFRCSIEMEPKTLNQGLLNHAREVAVDIVLNKEPNEASNIFAEGLKPVVDDIKDIARTDQKGNPLVYNQLPADEWKEKMYGTGCQCSFTSPIIDSPADQSKLKEPLSAPF